MKKVTHPESHLSPRGGGGTYSFITDLPETHPEILLIFTLTTASIIDLDDVAFVHV